MMRFAAGVLVGALLAGATGAQAVECRSVGGHINGERTTAVRQVELKGRTLHLSGRMGGQSMPRRTLPCVPLAAGVICEQVFGPVTVNVMTRGAQMVESVTDNASGQDVGGFSYECKSPIARIR